MNHDKGREAVVGVFPAVIEADAADPVIAGRARTVAGARSSRFPICFLFVIFVNFVLEKQEQATPSAPRRPEQAA
ncbi:MAG: hypothetical protein R6X33_15570 [Candidatus Brocadiia bacterium]